MEFLKKNVLFLAPMSGYSDSAYRHMLKKLGADVCVSEFVHCAAVLHRAKAVFEKLFIDKNERPCGIQIFGCDPSEMAQAAQIIENEFAPEFLDINFGCPAPNAVLANAGAALLKDTNLMCKIVEKVSASLKKTPVTAKLRTGYTKDSIIVPKVISQLEDAGAKMIVLHGRTKSQGYMGQADWQLIEECARHAKVPFIGNGSVETLSAEFLKNSKCFGFMIGRHALVNPWIFAEVKSKILGTDFKEPLPQDKINLAKEYLEIRLSKDTISISDFKHSKSQIVKFLRGGEGFKDMRFAISRTKNFEELTKIFL